MRDPTGRNIDYLRVSVTDRCNLRCAYCVPAEGVEPLSEDENLSKDELMKILGVARSLGVRHVRFTGGEPLVHPDLTDLIRGAKEIGMEDISLTTNGVLLAPMARALKDAGLSRVNVSLDSVRPEVFRQITRVGSVDDALAGIRAAIDVGLEPVKVNAVVMAGVNENEVADLAQLSRDMPIHVRFIEVMPIGPDPDANARCMVPIDQVKAKLASAGVLEAIHGLAGAGPAQSFRFRGAKGTVGFIAPLSYPFCGSCNRIRLTADGKLRPCLASDIEIDLRPCFKNAAAGGVTKCLEAAFAQALDRKPQGHELWNHPAHMRRMCQIGG